MTTLNRANSTHATTFCISKIIVHGIREGVGYGSPAAIACTLKIAAQAGNEAHFSKPVSIVDCEMFIW